MDLAETRDTLELLGVYLLFGGGAAWQGDIDLLSDYGTVITGAVGALTVPLIPSVASNKVPSTLFWLHSSSSCGFSSSKSGKLTNLYRAATTI